MSSRTRRTRPQRATSLPFTPSPEVHPTEDPGHRQVRLEHILRDELQSLLGEEASDPALAGVEVLSASLSPDGGHARVAYAVRGALDREAQVREASRAGLRRATGFLRARLAQQLDWRRLPQLSFTFVGMAGGEP